MSTRALSENTTVDLALTYEIERVSRLFSRREIASVAGVLEEDVCKFEKRESLENSVSLRLRAAYHTLDVSGFRILSPYR